MIQEVLLLLRQLRCRREQLRVPDSPLRRRGQGLEKCELLRTQHPVRRPPVRERRSQRRVVRDQISDHTKLANDLPQPVLAVLAPNEHHITHSNYRHCLHYSHSLL